MAQASLDDIQRAVDEWIGQFEEGYWPPLANLARLTEEVGELAREVNDQFGPKPKKPTEAEGTIREELGDILFVVAALANSVDVSLQEAFLETLAKYERRDANRWTRR